MDKNKECSVAGALLTGLLTYIEPCSERAFVGDQNGKHLYKMPNFKFWDITSDKSGSRFAVFERGRSFMHEFGQGTYDRLRLLVYRTETGEKLLEHKWSETGSENAIYEGVGLSDGGSQVYICRNGEPEPTLTFAVPEKAHP